MPSPTPYQPQTPSRRQMLSMMAAAPAALPLLGARPARASASPATKPNVLVIMTDQERADVVLPPGFTLPARAKVEAAGVRFTMHHTPTAPCSPARSTFFTGFPAPVTGMLDNVQGTDPISTALAPVQSWSPSLRTDIPTAGTIMKKAGYHTAYLGKWHLSDPVAEDPAALSAYGFDEALDILGGGRPNEGTEEDPALTEHAIEWLDRHGNDTEPWLCVVSLVNPHDMMFCPRFYRLEDVPDFGAQVPPNFESDLSTKPQVQTVWRGFNEAVGGVMPDEITSALGRRQWQQWGNWYLELLRRTDELMGSVLAALDRSAAAGNTVVVRVADHGELGGAHGLRQKGAMIYRENLRVPLVIADPRNPATHGTMVACPTSHVDLVPTLAAIAGVDPSARGPVVGQDLTPLLIDPAGAVRDAILVTSDAKSSGGQVPGVKYRLRGAITPRYSFGRYSTAEHIDGPRSTYDYELYDRREDPLELRNLAHNGGEAGLVAEMNDLVDALVARELRPLGAGGR